MHVLREPTAQWKEVAMRIATVFGVLLVAVAAAANPVAEELYIDFDPPNHVDAIFPPPYTTVDAYVVMQYLPYDIYSIAFDIEVDPSTGVLTDFIPAEPGYSVQGAPGEGIIVASSDCFTEQPVVLGSTQIYYLGQPGFVNVVEHPYAGHTFVTCGDPGEEHGYCVTLGGGIGTGPLGVIIYCSNPVENTTWGAMKALYR
jgi:hypothetical protein